jgi:hypothetical protein
MGSSLVDEGLDIRAGSSVRGVRSRSRAAPKHPCQNVDRRRQGKSEDERSNNKVVKEGALAPEKQSVPAAAPAGSVAGVAARLKLDPKRLEKNAQDADAAAAAFEERAWKRIDRDLPEALA